jgi:hypothetical protein
MFPNFLVYIMKRILISEKQEKFLKEQKGLLFEYYIQASNPKKDFKILGDLQVWVYGDDRNGFTPHCHVMTIDKETEFEVSLIDWSILNVKNGEPTSSMQKRFFKWLNSENTRGLSSTNKKVLYVSWDSTNPNNDLQDFCNKHKIIPTDEELAEHIK